MDTLAPTLNKTVWLLWLQGWDKAPWLVQQVAESWKINNPTWNIVLLDLETIGDYISDVNIIYDQSKKMIPQHRADIVRLSLLKNHGGVWADATMLCMQPLDHWVFDAVEPAGFWTYRSGSNAPCIWFMISKKDNYIVRTWFEAALSYWDGRIKHDHYNWMDHAFTRNLIHNDKEFKSLWNKAPRLWCGKEGDGGAHSCTGERMKQNIPELKKRFHDRPPYALKLGHRFWQGHFPDTNTPECQESNGYYAIQLSKRGFIYHHRMH